MLVINVAECPKIKDILKTFNPNILFNFKFYRGRKWFWQIAGDVLAQVRVQINGKSQKLSHISDGQDRWVG